MEHEITDPSPLYFANGNVYNPLIQRLLSQVGQQPISVPPGQGPGEGLGGFGPSQAFGNPSGLSGSQIASNLLTVASAYSKVDSGIGLELGGESPIPIPFVGGPLSDIFDLFGGGNDPEIPRQMRHKRHPVYRTVVRIQPRLLPVEYLESGKSSLHKDGRFGLRSPASIALSSTIEAATAAEIMGGGPEDRRSRRHEAEATDDVHRSGANACQPCRGGAIAGG